MTQSLDSITDFMLELDQLKNIERKSFITSGTRRENSAEHSWHLAMAVWAFSEHLEDDFDVLKLIKMALTHDLGEIYAGDTFLFSPDRDNAAEKERESMLKTAGHHGNPIKELTQVWDDQEYGQSKEAQLLKVLDRLLPFLLNLNTKGGGPWKEFNIQRSQVLSHWLFVQEIAPDIFKWVEQKIDFAVAQGWLGQD